MSNVFVSYVRDDQPAVDLLVAELRREGLHVWLDRDDILPGHFWEDALRNAIRNGAYFLACFSQAYQFRQQTYMNEELRIACGEISSHVREVGWLIPVLLSPCEIPPYKVDEGRTLRDLQWVDLSSDWNTGIWKLLQIVRPALSYSKDSDSFFRRLCRIHIQSKIDRAWSMGAHRVGDIETAWRSLLNPSRWNPTLQIMVDLFEKMKSVRRPLTERWIEPTDRGIVICVTVSPTATTETILQNLPTQESDRQHPYEDFVLTERRILRNLVNWPERDFAHWIFALDGDDFTVDLYYRESLDLKLVVHGLRFERAKQGKPTPPIESMIPGSILTAPEAERIEKRIIEEEVRLLSLV